MNRRPLAFLAVAVATLAVLTLPRRSNTPSPPPPPLAVQALATPHDARATRSPLGARIDGSGRLTILSAPGTEGNPEPSPPEPGTRGTHPQPAQPVPAAMLAGIRALFRLTPPPRESLAELRIATLERKVGQGRLMLVDGCFRFDRPDGPHAVFPPGTGLALKDGSLVVGLRGAPPELSARVGEEIFWEGGVRAITERDSLRRIARYCGPGPAVVVVPGSAAAQQARNDALAASEWMRTYGEKDWDAALAAVRACRARMSEGLSGQFPGKPNRVMVDNMCGNIPPPVVTRPEDCPQGSRLRAGVCVTPEGHRRPIPR